jgi:hypothetical protein
MSYEKAKEICGAVQQGEIEKIQELVNISLQLVNAEMKDGTSPIFYVTQKEIAEYLLAHGARIDTISKHGYSPLHAAAEKGCVEIAELILKRGADINAKAESDYTPLHGASRNGQTQMVGFLLDNGASIDSLLVPQGGVAQERYSAIEMAALYGYKETVSLLLKRGAQADLTILAKYFQKHAMLSGEEIVFPAICCCCAALNGTTTFPVNPYESVREGGFWVTKSYHFSVPVCEICKDLLEKNSRLFTRFSASGGVVGLVIGSVVAFIILEWLVIFAGGMIGLIIGYIFYCLAREPDLVKVNFGNIAFRNSNYQSRFDAIELSEILASRNRTTTDPGDIK